MRRFSVAMGMGVALVSCRQDPPTPEATAEPEAVPEVTAPAIHYSGARAVVEETDDFLFEYSYPQEAGNIVELAQLLDRRLETQRVELVWQSAEARGDARQNGFPFNKYSNGVTWKVVAETPLYLSLSADLTSYTGGAHGNYGFDTLVWDKGGGLALQPVDFFTSIAALDAVIGPDLCDLLNRERAVRRGIAVEEGSDSVFDKCVPLSDATILLGSTNGAAFDRIGVQMAPYVAGSYAEGAFEFTLPVNAAVMEVVAEDYRAAFSTRN